MNPTPDLEGVTCHVRYDGSGVRRISPWHPTRSASSVSQRPCEYCKASSHSIHQCGKLWMLYYGETTFKRPVFVEDWLKSSPKHAPPLATLQPEDVECGPGVGVLHTDLCEPCPEPDYRYEDETTSLGPVTISESPSSTNADRVEIPNSLVYMDLGGGRILLECMFDGVKCKALVDSGAAVSGISSEFYIRSDIPTKPTTLPSYPCRSITGEEINTTQQLANVPISIGEFQTTGHFLILPVS